MISNKNINDELNKFYNFAVEIDDLYKNSEGISDSEGNPDDLYKAAKEIVIQYQKGSISLLQRILKIGYVRAAMLIDEMEEEGIVGPHNGTKPRDVYILPDELD